MLPPVPRFDSGMDLAAIDAWIVEAAGIYQREVTIRRREHQCMTELRDKGVIQ